ncbi:MAG: DNA polymerase III subunit delta [Deltaproteobacteria bacterium]|nr:DNA polymerase III subunit delta [Deltaproteobacteria bacterium]
MARDLTTILAELKAGKHPRVALVFGDDLQTQETCRAIVNTLVPESDRGFNLERLDARTVPWDRIESSLMTPPFFPGTKVIWVENAPYFFSRDQKGELGEKVLELWREGKRDEAAKLLGDLLVVEGWTQERWEQLDAASTAAILELLEADDGAERADAEAVISHAKSKAIELTGRAGMENHRLGELLDRGLPQWDFLLLTALQVDRRTKLFKRFEELGAALFLGLERDRYGKVSRESLIEFINRRIKQTGKTLEPAAREMIATRAGDDLRTLNQELEKLVLYCGERPTIGAKDVDMILLDQGEGWIFDLTRAMGERNALAALAQLARLTGQGEHPLKLLGTIAGEVRRLLAARQLLDGELRGRWRRGMSYQQFQQIGAPPLTRNPYGDYMNFQRAEQFSLTELRAHMERIFDADLRLKSSGSQPRLVMEQLILSMCLGGQRRNPLNLGRAHL